MTPTERTEAGLQAANHQKRGWFWWVIGATSIGCIIGYICLLIWIVSWSYVPPIPPPPSGYCVINGTLYHVENGHLRKVFPED